MSDIVCPICGGKDCVSLSSVFGRRLFNGEQNYCLSCSHGWRAEKIEYPYETTQMCILGTTRARLERQFRFFAPFLPADPEILEIGCASGELAAFVREKSPVKRYDAVELSPLGEKAKAHLDALYAEPLGDLLQRGVVKTRYDIVVISHVLEHIEDPRAEIRAIKSVLKPGGVIFIEVPHGSGNRNLPANDFPAHLHFFSVPSLVRLLGGEGLETVAIATDAIDNDQYNDAMELIARPIAAPRWRGDVLSDHPLLQGGGKIVVWGASPLAEELLGNYFDPGRIDFFVDKDSAKQGCTCLGKPIRAPEALGGSPRTVLINSVYLADDIVADLARLYPGVGHKAVRLKELLYG